MSVGIVNSVHDPAKFGQISLSKTNLRSLVTHAQGPYIVYEMGLRSFGSKTKMGISGG